MKKTENKAILSDQEAKNFAIAFASYEERDLPNDAVAIVIKTPNPESCISVILREEREADTNDLVNGYVVSFMIDPVTKEKKVTTDFISKHFEGEKDNLGLNGQFRKLEATRTYILKGNRLDRVGREEGNIRHTRRGSNIPVYKYINDSIETSSDFELFSHDIAIQGKTKSINLKKK